MQSITNNFSEYKTTGWVNFLNNRTIRQKIPKMVACIFALWTIKASPEG